jgi:hypothetical protein
MSAARLPEFLRPYFWDTDFDQLDPVQHERFIAERLMEKTTQKSFRWLLALVRRRLPQEPPVRPRSRPAVASPTSDEESSQRETAGRTALTP